MAWLRARPRIALRDLQASAQLLVKADWSTCLKCTMPERRKSKPYIDDFCAGFCAEILEGISALEVSIMFESTSATQMRAKTDEWRNEFGWTKRKREFAKPMERYCIDIVKRALPTLQLLL